MNILWLRVHMPVVRILCVLLMPKVLNVLNVQYLTVHIPMLNETHAGSRGPALIRSGLVRLQHGRGITPRLDEYALPDLFLLVVRRDVFNDTARDFFGYPPLDVPLTG